MIFECCFLMFWVVLLFVVHAMTKGPSSPAVAGDAEQGNAEIVLNMGRTSEPAISAAIAMDKLCLSLWAAGSCPSSAIHDSFPLTSTSGTILSKVYGKLAKDKDWIVSVQSFDKSGKVIHSAAATFKVQSCQTTRVNLELQTGFSMLVANIFPVQETMNSCVLYVDQTAVDSSVFTRGTRVGDTIALTYDYLAASAVGTRHALRVEVHGVLWDKQQLLYAGETTLTAVSGQDKSWTLPLKWVGPTSSLYGAAEMNVVLGAISTSAVTAAPQRAHEYQEAPDGIELCCSVQG